MANLKLVASSARPAAAGTPRSARSRRATPKSEQTRALILEAAVDCINQHGFHGTNMARVADIAGVTRGCLQYYFTTKQDIDIALAQHVARRNWEIYESQATHPPPGRDLVEFAIDLIANPTTERYRVAHLELLTAARTTPNLRPVLQEAAQMVEAQAKRFTARLFGNADLADMPQFRAARDLTTLVNDWLFVHIFPDRREERIAEVIAALRIALHTLWRIPSLEGEADLAKPRIRVKAAKAEPATGAEKLCAED
jgi:AcrR family transcriptional regulator